MIERIRSNEERLDKILDAVNELNNALDKFENIQEDLIELNKYYGSEEWFKDKELHDSGKIKNIKAGVLSEDGVWNALTDIRAIYEKMYEISNKEFYNKMNLSKGGTEMTKKITYVTGNWAKLESAKKVFEPIGYTVDNIKLETPEIQADDVSEVAKYSAKWAAEKLNCSVIKNDTGLFVEGLNGFPGVYTHYVDDTLGEDGLLKLMDGIENRNAYFKESIAYCEPGCEPVVFEGITKGRIATEKSGEYGWSWDFVFIPEGEEKTLGCFPDDERWKFWSLDSYTRLVNYLETKDTKNVNSEE